MDHYISMGKAVAKVFSEAWHGLCTFYIMQNAIKHLHEEKDEDKNENKRKKKNTGKRKEKNEEEKREYNEDKIFYQILVHVCLSIKT